MFLNSIFFMKILVVKHGALGDVVRTSYFAKFIKRKYPSCRLDWFTAPQSLPLVEVNPFIDDVILDARKFAHVRYDVVYSLDDEFEIVRAVGNIASKRYVGAYLDGGKICYTPDVSEWFDMGIHSVYGLEAADRLKKSNLKSHGEIFCRIFGVDSVEPNLYYRKCDLGRFGSELFKRTVIGINPFAGGRWKSKQLPVSELLRLIKLIVEKDVANKFSVVLLGQGDDYLKNVDVVHSGGFPPAVVSAIDTTGSLADFMTLVGCLSYLVTSDSLAMHLAIAQSVKTIAFFSPTSASEIDDFGCCMKVQSRLADYCNYKSDNDNSDITAERIYAELVRMF